MMSATGGLLGYSVLLMSPKVLVVFVVTLHKECMSLLLYEILNVPDIVDEVCTMVSHWISLTSSLHVELFPKAVASSQCGLGRHTRTYSTTIRQLLAVSMKTY